MENVNDQANTRTDVDKFRYLAALSYVNPLFLFVLLLLDSRSNYVRHHANQAVCLWLWFAACGIVCIVPILGWIAGVVGTAAGIVFIIIAIVRTLKREYYEIPIIGKHRIVPEA